MSVVDPADWREAVEGARAEGFGFFDWLGAVDEIGRSGAIRLLLVLRRSDSPAETVTLTTELARDGGSVASIRDLFAGAAWQEREVAECFGVRFSGGDARRLLLPPGETGPPPLRKDHVLAARTGTAWPGAKEPGESGPASGRRRMAPPGVPEPEVWGDRPDQSEPDPEEVAAALGGGRVRRRSR